MASAGGRFARRRPTRCRRWWCRAAPGPKARVRARSSGCSDAWATGCGWSWRWWRRLRPRRPASSRRWCRCPAGASRRCARLDRSAQSPKRFLAVKQLDVLGLSRRKAPHRPREVDEMRLARGHQRVHAALFGQVVALPGIAGAAGGHHVGPLVVATARQRDQVIPRQALTVTQLELGSMAILAAIAVAGEEECVGDLAAEAAGNVHELDQPDDGWFG